MLLYLFEMIEIIIPSSFIFINATQMNKNKNKFSEK